MSDPSTKLSAYMQQYPSLGPVESAVELLIDYIGTGVAPATSTKTLIASTSATSSIPTGFIAGMLYVGTGATVTVDGIPLVAGQSVVYNPSSKLHPAVNWTSLTGGTLYGWYEV